MWCRYNIIEVEFTSLIIRFTWKSTYWITPVRSIKYKTSRINSWDLLRSNRIQLKNLLIKNPLTKRFMLVSTDPQAPLALSSLNEDWESARTWSLHNVLYRRFTPWSSQLSLSLFYLSTFSFLGELLPFLDTFTIFYCPFHLANETPCPPEGERRRGDDLSNWWISHVLRRMSAWLHSLLSHRALTTPHWFKWGLHSVLSLCGVV
jgi:hypothetical protein